MPFVVARVERATRERPDANAVRSPDGHLSLTRLPELELVGGPLRRQWLANLGLRGLMTLLIRWRA
jgi:hypothetical protein